MRTLGFDLRHGRNDRSYLFLERRCQPALDCAVTGPCAYPRLIDPSCHARCKRGRWRAVIGPWHLDLAQRALIAESGACRTTDRQGILICSNFCCKGERQNDRCAPLASRNLALSRRSRQPYRRNPCLAATSKAGIRSCQSALSADRQRRLFHQTGLTLHFAQLR